MLTLLIDISQHVYQSDKTHHIFSMGKICLNTRCAILYTKFTNSSKMQNAKLRICKMQKPLLQFSFPVHSSMAMFRKELTLLLPELSIISIVISIRSNSINNSIINNVILTIVIRNHFCYNFFSVVFVVCVFVIIILIKSQS